MASDRPFARAGRARKHDYRLLNDGSDDEADIADRMEESQPKRPQPVSSIASQSIDSSLLALDSNISPLDSASQVVSTISPAQPLPTSLNLNKPKPENAWIWSHYSIEVLESLWIPRGKSQPILDRLASCIYCNKWTIKDSNRKGSISNMYRYIGLEYQVYPAKQDISNLSSSSRATPSIASLFLQQSSKDVMKLFEKNMVQWIIAENMAFLSIESPFFQQMINDIPGLSMPFKSRNTLSSRISDEFNLSRQYLIEDLAISSQTIALSLDSWTSKNNISILGIIRHWLTEDFEYKERVLEFAEISGPKSGENMAGIVLPLLQELDIEYKVITITGDNASNNEILVDTIDSSLLERFLIRDNISNMPRFDGQNSYIRYITHILNLIVKLILKTLNSGDCSTANDSIELVSTGQYIYIADSALARLRVLIIWISRSLERKTQWRNICRDNNLPTKLIPYDVDIRWNSTFLMLEASIKARRQISRWIASYSDIPQFTELDWSYLSEVASVLERFYEYTEYISRTILQMSYAVPIYYDLHDILYDAANRTGDFTTLSENISDTVQSSLELFSKYYDFMDSLDIYYIALILNPRYKTRLIEQELKEDAGLIIKHIKEVLHRQYL